LPASCRQLQAGSLRSPELGLERLCGLGRVAQRIKHVVDAVRLLSRGVQ